jgi:transcriptional regulator with XRE-family HTH domain
MTPAELTAWRARLGLSKVEAAKALGCARYSLAIWEQGKRPIPKYIELACQWLALRSIYDWHGGLPPPDV